MAHPQSSQNSRPVLFANTGVQIVCIPLQSKQRFSIEQAGSGWQYCKLKVEDEVVEHGYVQWQILNDKLFLAVDTTVGPDDANVGYFAKANSFGGDFLLDLTGLLDLAGAPLQGLPPMELVIRPATAEGGEPRPVHMVVDFGNSRTGALLVEYRGDTRQEPLMMPLQLVNRYHLDAWDDGGQLSMENAEWWFAARSYWCTPPYRPAPKLEKTIYKQRTIRGSFLRGERVEQVPVTVVESPRTFEDFSMVRMGPEADDLAGVVRTEGETRIGVSSPKRYLWARDASWLEGANWHMADPFDRYDAEHHATPLKGPLLRFFPENDVADDPSPDYEEASPKPRHAPRTLMIGALYEMLCQAYGYVNSLSYRHMTGVERMRIIKSLTLTYPSGMIASERERLWKQARKAVRIFMQTLGEGQGVEPEIELSVDEASAVHLTYIWSEVQKLGRKPSLWFSVMGRLPDDAAEQEKKPPQVVEKTKPSGRAGRSNRPDRRKREKRPKGPKCELPVSTSVAVQAI